ncbi:hypothetical protein [Methylorubrum extorquens]|nr:hypothetical protein [Methylorubrum extorquens]
MEVQVLNARLPFQPLAHRVAQILDHLAGFEPVLGGEPLPEAVGRQLPVH